MQFFVGGPLAYVRSAALAAGIPAETAASTTLANEWATDWRDGMDLTDASDFTSTGAIRLVDPSGVDFWFTFESRSGNTLLDINPVFERRNAWTAPEGAALFPAGTTVSQWYDISEFVTSWRRKQISGPGESYWVLELSGIEWNSLQIYPDAAVLAVATHYDDILGFHDPAIWFTGFLDEPKVKGDPNRNEWTVSAQGRRKYLKLQRNTPGQYGGELVDGTWTASDPLQDLAAEPTEGQNPSDFSVANISDEDEGSLYIAKDFPSVTTLNGGPVGATEADTRLVPLTPLKFTGQGLRITQCYFNPVPSGAHTAQSQKWLVIYNNTQLEAPALGPEEYPYPEKWGIIDLSTYHLELRNKDDSRCGSNVRPTVIYLGTKVGPTTAAINLKPQTGAVICFDESVFRSQFSIPTGWTVVEIKQCQGDKFGTDLAVSQRGVGLTWDPDPTGCWVALRDGGRAGNDQDDGRYSAEVAADAGGDEITLTNVTAPGLSSWPTSGYVRSENGNRLACYTGVDVGASKLTGVTRPVPGDRAAAIAVADRVNVRHSASYWMDFVAIGDIVDEIPTDFPVKRVGSYGDPDDGSFRDQNDGPKGERVWGIWATSANGYTVGTTPIFWEDGSSNVTDFLKPEDWGAQPDARKVAPACPVLQAVRRRETMGGGQLEEKPSGPQWYHHDSNSWLDWEVQAGPRIGNVDALDSFVYLQFEATEHAAATVEEDNSDVNDADETLTVGTNEAREYPTASPRDGKAWYMRALTPGGGHVDFRYDYRDGSTFGGVKKGPGYEGVEIPAGSTLVTMINTKATWNTTGADSYIQKNLPIATGLSLRRWIGLRSASVLDYSAGTLTVRPGQAAGFPSAGTLILQPVAAVTSGGITVVPASFNPDTFRATYSGRTDSAFTGVTLLGVTPQSGWTVTPYSASALNFPADMDILISREDNPVSPLLFIDNNESWDVAYKSAFGNQRDGTVLPAGVMERFFPFGGGAGSTPFVQWIFVKVHRMTDDGRFKANTVRVHRLPARSQSSAGDRSSQDDWQMKFTTASLAHDIFLDAGVPANLMWFSGGEQVRTYRLSEGNVWDSARGLAELSGCVLQETADGRILFKRDPQASGAPFATAGKVLIDEEAVWGDIEAVEQPRHAVAQIRLEAKNPVQDQFYTVFSPSSANPLGIVKTVSGRITPNQEAAEHLARLLFRKANGGWTIRVPSGPFATVLEYGDVVRFVDQVDVAGRFFAQEMVVRSITEEGEQDRLRVTLELQEWVTI